jgi:hypothetical protein
MEFDKSSFKKAFPFLASILPGAALFYLFEIGHPGTLQLLLTISFLGYGSRLSLLLLLFFLIGYSFNKFLAAFFWPAGWVLGRMIKLPLWDRHPYKSTDTPWRDQKWRAAYAKRFSINAPQDLALTPDHLDEQMIAAISKLQPGDQPSPEQQAYGMQLLQAAVERIGNDKEWRSRYLQLHVAEITKRERGFVEEIGAGLDSNLTITSLIILIASWFVPQVRSWWLLLPAYLWFAESLLVATQKTVKFFEPSSTLQAQYHSLNSSKPGNP